ncbi:aryl-alcohol dehydrogenase-like predicted oxidoreductase [Saccharomonospora amisosensis]|uniref:Aryl-alcohol dehydrogenase-like predicted oxidoreductase n=1 Tax=Saccharomonospora amisosensis TaxID=1128677 RepID=A0A7X5UQ67_9PSEU|nr:aldo/keto reductase [Saccharomonospora amisosensis]NIJ12198.1 aryl-alcohol dehydrogenase-like predicted oxidoreductase [Saccharomonospora amisosensis]
MTNTARIAVGLAALGRPAYLNLGRTAALPSHRDVEAMRSATYAVLDRAYAAGIRRVDAARSYGRAEEFLAAWLADRGHTDVIVSSKWGYRYVGQWRLDARVHEVKEHSLERFREQWAETAALLGDVITLYQVHSLTADSGLFTDEPLLEALAELADRGVAVGFTTSGPGQAETIRRALELQVAGVRLFSAVQSTWNPLETSAGQALADAHAAGVLVQVKETLANGRLAVEPPRRLTELAEAHEVSTDAVALAFVFAQSWADVVLLGPAGPEQLAANLVGAQLALDSEDLAALAELREEPERYWSRRSGMHWQ